MAEFQNILELTANVVSAYLARNQTAPDALPGLIHDVYSALAKAGAPPEAPAQEPAVPIRRSEAENLSSEGRQRGVGRCIGG